MNQVNKLNELSCKNNGILITNVTVAQGISKAVLANFVKENQYERVSRGIYCSKDSWFDKLYLLQLRCPKTIYSHDTALFLLGMTDQEPLNYTLTAKTGYNPTHLTKDGIKVFTIKQELFELGVTEVSTPFGNKVRVYDAERTLCDMLRSRNEIEIQSVLEALKNYVHRRDKNLPKLMDYAKQLHVDKIMKLYMEVLL